MAETKGTERRKKDRRVIPDRRSNSDRRLATERRHGERRVETVAVKRERRSGVDRRAHILSTLSTRDHIVVHALRRLIGRLYQLAKAQPRSGTAQERLAEARSEILKLDPSLYLVAKTIDGLKGGAIGKLEEFQHAQEMLARFMPRPSRASAPKRKSAGKNGARKSASSSKRTTKKQTAAKRSTKKKVARKSSTPRKTTS
jgi:hypothetical protein